jgi:hypothetical protein
VVYLLHFEKPYRHARHYLGFCEDGGLEERIDRHRRRDGARLVAVIVEHGINFVVARTWDGDRSLERRLKNQKKARNLCPICRGQDHEKMGRMARPSLIEDR